MLWGDVEAAACTHAVHAALWQRFGLMPERFDWSVRDAVRGVSFYPLRPEFAEVTYWLYRATRHPHYLWLGRRILRNLERFTRVRHVPLLSFRSLLLTCALLFHTTQANVALICRCGYATVHDVNERPFVLEDRMESFFFSETTKYLFLVALFLPCSYSYSMNNLNYWRLCSVISTSWDT